MGKAIHATVGTSYGRPAYVNVECSMQNNQYNVIHVHSIGVYTVFRKHKNLRTEGYWLHVGDYVHDDFGNLVEV